VDKFTMLDTISLISGDFSPMSISSQDLAQQLSGQLHLVSEIAESLTLRLLALEERFNELSERSFSVESEQTDDSDSFSLLADSSDRLEQLRGLLNERSEVETQLEVPRLEAVTDSYIAPDHVLDESENFDLEQTVYVNDSQEPPSDTVDQCMEQIDDLLSA
jgi:predicted nuclease with TOPRIM domain